MLEDLYRQMVRIRVVEEGIASHYNDQEMRCPVHLSTGQEAVAVGVCSHLTTNDWVFSTHRSHAHYLAKGGNLKKMLAELHGRQTGCCHGRGGSMHLVDKDVNFYAVPIVASAIPIAVGVAKAIKQRQGKEVVVCFFGDAAMESGQFYEALNLAALWQLPILFVMEDNNLSVSTPKESRQPSYARTTRDLVRSCGVSHFQAYGMDVGKVHEEAGSAIHYTKVGWPRFLECYSLQRYREHCGPNESPDSCDRMMDWVLGLSLRSDCLLGDAVNDAQSEFDEALAFANTSLWPDTSKLEEGVYAN